MQSQAQGQNWLRKAVNPAEDLTCAGIPDSTTSDIVSLNYVSQYTIGKPATVTDVNGTWNADLFFISHPVFFGSAMTYKGGMKPAQNYALPAAPILNQSVSPLVGETPVTAQRLVNTQIGLAGDTIFQKTNKYRDLVTRHRCQYMSVTVIPDVSDLYNSGQIVNTQQQMAAAKTFDTGRNMWVYYFSGQDIPTYDNSVNNPRAYSGRFKEGVYSVKKILNPYQSPFIGTDTQVGFASPLYGASNIELTNVDVGNEVGTVTVTGPLMANAPFQATGVAMPADLSTNYGGINPNLVTMPTCDLMDNGTISINMVGIHPNASIRVIVRMGIEAQVQAGTAYTIFKQLSPHFDEVALRKYMEVTRSSPDGYPGQWHREKTAEFFLGDTQQAIMPRAKKHKRSHK